MAERKKSEQKKLMFLFLSLPTDEFEILALGHMEWIFQKETIYCSLFLVNCFPLCQVDPLKQPSPYLTF